MKIIHLEKLKDAVWMGDVFEQHGFNQRNCTEKEYSSITKAKIFIGGLGKIFSKNNQHLVFYQWTGEFSKKYNGIEAIDVSNLIKQ